jgi:hypothetical protein
MIFWQIDIAMRDNAKNLYAMQLKSIGRGMLKHIVFFLVESFSYIVLIRFLLFK